jgi:dethiobiotin synthetase
MANRGIFVAGTGTEVGKTHIGAMIAGAIMRAGYRVGVYKPVASGCRKEADGLFCDDASELWREAGRPGEFAKVCPQVFRAALSPPLAARKEGKQVDPALLRSGLEYWRSRSDVVVVEGAGGLMSPLSEHDYNIDLAAEFGFPLVIVAANRLGVVNDVLQTVITARTRAPKLPIAGIILNQTTSRRKDESLESNVEEVAKRCDAPLLATVWHGQRMINRSVADWFDLAGKESD